MNTDAHWLGPLGMPTDIKTVNAVEKDNFMCISNFPEDGYDSAWAQATGEEDPGSSGNISD